MEEFSKIDSESTLVIGRTGRLARAFQILLPHARILGRPDIDISSRLDTIQAIARLAPSTIINCAALTNMRDCDDNPDAAWAVNVRGVRNLAEAAQEVDSTLVHFSSDYAMRPVNEYGWTKRASESIAHITVRAKLYDASHWAWRALIQGKPVDMTTVEFANPITTTKVAQATIDLVSHRARGLILLGSAQRLSFYEIGLIWARVLSASPDLVRPIGAVSSDTRRLAEMFIPPTGFTVRGVTPPVLEEDARQHLELSRTLSFEA